MLKLEQLDNCFPCLLDMNIKLTDEPGRTETLDKFIIPDMIEHYDGKYTTCDIYLKSARRADNVCFDSKFISLCDL